MREVALAMSLRFSAIFHRAGTRAATGVSVRGQVPSRPQRKWLAAAAARSSSRPQQQPLATKVACSESHAPEK